LKQQAKQLLASMIQSYPQNSFYLAAKFSSNLNSMGLEAEQVAAEDMNSHWINFLAQESSIPLILSSHHYRLNLFQD
jgi:hypothetical protein